MPEAKEQRGVQRRAAEVIGFRRSPEKILSTVIIDDAQAVIDQRNELFPGWSTYGGAENMPDHSKFWLHLRSQFYPGWWTTVHATSLPTELRSQYQIRCPHDIIANLAIYPQPRNVRVRILMVGVKKLEDEDCLKLLQPPFYFCFNDVQLIEHPYIRRVPSKDVA